MAKQTGQITYPKNNQILNFEETVRFIFTKNNGERITRDTTSKGVINFDIPSGEWNVSWFALKSNQFVVQLRPGLQLKITSSTPPTALADWIYGDNTHVADPILAGWKETLDEMKAVRDEFRKETSFVGDKNEPIVRRGYAGIGGRIKVISGTDTPIEILTGGSSGFYANNSFNSGFERNYTIYLKHFDGYESALSWDYGGSRLTLETASAGQKSKLSMLHDKNTIVDSNGNYKPASPVIQLHHNRVEYNEDFDKDNIPQFEHLATGVYRITNVREICKDGWTFNKPINGKGQPFFMLKYEQEDETTLIVKVFERTFNSKTGEFGFGEPRDIGADERWVDFHFEVDHERIAREEAQMQKEQEEWEEQERLRKEAEDKAEKEAQKAWEAEMAKQEAETETEKGE